MQIRTRETGQVLYAPDWIKWVAINYGKSVSGITEEVINRFDSDLIYEGAQATGGTVYQYSQFDGHEEVDGKWYTKYRLGPVFSDKEATLSEPAKTAAEQEAEYKTEMDIGQATRMREERNRRLLALDWTQGKDVPDSISAPAAVVRQALRDVPSQAGFPWTIDWPELA